MFKYCQIYVITVKKKKTISIKDPRLRNIRDSLRYAITEVESGLIRDFMARKFKIPSGDERCAIWVDRIDMLETAWKNSICVCSVCGSQTSDMTYNPVEEKWFCVRCYEENQAFYIKRGEGYLYP